jgi:hypothetical protein
MDDIFKQLRDLPVPAGLAQIDDAVFAALGARRVEAKSMPRLLSLAAVFALGFGYFGGGMVPAPALAAEPQLVLTETALAPSTLLELL